MLIDRPQIVEGSVIVNATVPSGTSFPLNPANGELFYLTTDGSLYIFLQDSNWFRISLKQELDTHQSDTTHHLTPEQNTLLDGLNVTLTSTHLNFVDGVTSPIQIQIDAANTALNMHAADSALHLTPAQNSFIDAITATSTEVNYLSGVTSNVQTQINNTASTASSALASHAADQTLHLTSAQNTWIDSITATAAELNYSVGVTSPIQTQINNTASTAASNLAAHTADQALHLSSTQNTWIDSITASAFEVNQLVGATSPIQSQLNTKAAATDLSNHIADQSLHLTAAQNTWIDSITATATEVNYLSGVTSSIQTQLDSKLSLSGGSMTGSITIPTGQHVSIADAPSAPLHAANKGYVDSLISGLSWLNPILDPDLKDDSLNNPPITSTDEVYIIGAAPTGAWTSIGAGRAVYWNGANWIDILGRAVAIGDRFGVVLEHGGAGAGGLAGQATKVAQITNATPGAITYTFTTPINGNAVFVNNQLSPHFSHGYTYNSTTATWIEFAGPSAIPAGIGLSYSGNTLNVNLGAGIAQLPTDEVGIDIYTGGGLMTTVDGTNSSTASGAQLSLTKVGTAGTYYGVVTDAFGRVTANAGLIPNSALSNSSLTIGSTSISLGSTVSSLVGLTSITSTTFTGSLSGNASTATSAALATSLSGGVAGGVAYQTGPNTTAITSAGTSGQLLQSNGASAPTWTSAPTISGANITAGSIQNSSLANNTITIGSSVIGLGGSATVLSNLTSVAATTFYGTTSAFGTADTTRTTTTSSMPRTVTLPVNQPTASALVSR